MNYRKSLDRIRKNIEKEYSDVGLKIFQKSILKLDINENPSRNDIERLISDISETFVKLYGKSKSKEIFSKLQSELLKEDKALASQLNETLENFFRTNGIPRESDVRDMAKYLITSGFNDTEKELIEKLKQSAKDRILTALNNSIIDSNIKSFLDNFQPYKQSDVDDFIQYLKFTKLIVNESELRDEIERQRLFRKFNQPEPDEILDEKISRAYIALYDSSKSAKENKKVLTHYSYLLKPDDALMEFIKNIEII